MGRQSVTTVYPYCSKICCLCFCSATPPRPTMRKREKGARTVNDGTKDFEQLGDAVVPLGFVDETVEDVVDRLADERTVGHELACGA